jgi:hypothetical protein
MIPSPETTTQAERRPGLTTIADHDRERRLRELQDRTRRAWGVYSESLRELQGKDYEDAEHRSWERLQRKLRELELQRDELTGSPRRRGDDH